MTKKTYSPITDAGIIARIKSRRQPGRPLMLDLFCGEGGAGMGYNLAGFDVIGVDNQIKRHYPFKFFRCDAIAFAYKFGYLFDFIHASPPCKLATTLAAFSDPSHVDLIPSTVKCLRSLDKPYVIENVPGAKLPSPVIVLCGSSFKLFVQRHRLFSSNMSLNAPPCDHDWWKANSPGFYHLCSQTGTTVSKRSLIVSIHGSPGGKGGADLWREVMQMPWATGAGISQAIPPAYTKYLGEQVLDYLYHNVGDGNAN